MKRFYKTVTTQPVDNGHALLLDNRPVKTPLREPLVLQALGGFSSDEIANLLQLNVNTVNTRLFRARKLLRNHLEVLGEPRHE